MAISAVEKGRINKERYEEYVQNLRDLDAKFPVNQYGDVNLSKIAEECGFLRQVFARNKTMGERLKDDIKAIGTEISKPKNADEYLSIKVSDHEKLIGQLRKENAFLKETVESMKQQALEAESTIKRLEYEQKEGEESFDQMLQTGRRFTL